MASSKLVESSLGRHSLGGLYVITDPTWLPTTAQLLEGVEQALAGGAQLIQYRNKHASAATQRDQASELKRLCDRYQRPLLINDSLALAEALGCGVHLGIEDTDLAMARERLGPDAIIGATCHNSLELAAAAISAGASYIAFGRLYDSSSKPSAPLAQLATLQHAQQRWPNTPIVGIGGITLNNCQQVLQHGANMVAVIQAIWNTNNPQRRCQQFQSAFLASAARPISVKKPPLRSSNHPKWNTV